MPPQSPTKSGIVLAVVATSSTSHARHPEPDERARGGHPVVLVRVPGAAGQRPRRDDEPVRRLLRLPAQPRDLGGQRGEPVGLVAAQVRDAAQPGGGVGQGGERGDRRRDLARRRAGPGRPRGSRRCRSRSARRRPGASWRPCAPGSRGSRPPGCVVLVGQPGTRTVPPATSAAHRNGAALDRSGSTRTSRPAIGPGATRQIVGPGVVDLDAGLAQQRDRHLDVRQARQRPPGVPQGQALARTARRRAAGRRRTGSTPTRRRRPGRRARDPRPCTVNGR